MSNLSYHVLDDYIYREYEWIDPETKDVVVYKIMYPVGMYTAKNGKTHRVVDKNEIVHLVPTVGYMGCRVRYKKEPGTAKATF